MLRSARGRRQDAADEAVIRGLFQEHGRAMLAYAMRVTQDRGAAEDAVQEALIRAWRNLDDLLEREGSVRGWLLTVTRNIIIDQARMRSPHSCREALHGLQVRLALVAATPMGSTAATGAGVPTRRARSEVPLETATRTGKL